jgi:hypothetical protein
MFTFLFSRFLFPYWYILLSCTEALLMSYTTGSDVSLSCKSKPLMGKTINWMMRSYYNRIFLWMKTAFPSKLIRSLNVSISIIFSEQNKTQTCETYLSLFNLIFWFLQSYNEYSMLLTKEVTFIHKYIYGMLRMNTYQARRILSQQTL